MTALRIIGIVVGAWVVLGLAFIGPAQQLAHGPHPGAAAPLTLAGVVVVGVPAYLLIRRIVRQGRGVRR
jgi:hypothetical protein